MKLFYYLVGLFLCSSSLSSLIAEESANEWILDHLDTIENFPIPGVQFKCIGKLLKNPHAFKEVIQVFADHYKDYEIDAIAGLDSRGFIFGSTLAYELNLPFIMVRKAGKLPGNVVSISYSLEYGKSNFELQKASITPKQKILIIDDLIATGGSIVAAGFLIEQLGGIVVEVASLIELKQLNGRAFIPYPVFSLLQIE